MRKINTVIYFTPDQLIQAFLAACASVCTIAGAVAVICALVSKAKAPNKKQDERISELEKRVARHDEIFAKDKKSIESIEEGNRVTQKALLALLAHGIDGNNLQQMIDARDKLQNYLMEK